MSFFLLLLLSWQLALLLWLLISPSRLEMDQPYSFLHSEQGGVNGIALFGSEKSRADSLVVTPQLTHQAMRDWLLLGVFLDQDIALALVQMGTNGVRWLTLNDQLDNGFHVDAIFANEVRFRSMQSVQSLVLSDRQSGGGQSTQPSVQPLLRIAHQALKQNPMGALQFMRMDPVWESGQLSGMLLMPQTGQEALFSQIGLKPGDVLIGLNGDAVGAWMSKMAELPKVLESSGVRLKVLRAGSEIEWVVNW